MSALHAQLLFEDRCKIPTREAFPVDWAMTQNNLGDAYWNLPGGDRQANLERAIACYESAIIIFQIGMYGLLFAGSKQKPPES
jgi:hypothetical protein